MVNVMVKRYVSVTVRVPEQLKEKFYQHCENCGVSPHMKLKEFIEGELDERTQEDRGTIPENRESPKDSRVEWRTVTINGVEYEL